MIWSGLVLYQIHHHQHTKHNPHHHHHHQHNNQNYWAQLQGKDGNQTKKHTNDEDKEGTWSSSRGFGVGATDENGRNPHSKPPEDTQKGTRTQSGPNPKTNYNTNKDKGTEPSQSDGTRHPKGPQETTRHRAQMGGGGALLWNAAYTPTIC